MPHGHEPSLEANPLQTLLKKDGNVNQSISFFNLLFAFLTGTVIIDYSIITA